MIYNYDFHLEGPIFGFSSNYMGSLTIDWSEMEAYEKYGNEKNKARRCEQESGNKKTRPEKGKTEESKN